MKDKAQEVINMPFLVKFVDNSFLELLITTLENCLSNSPEIEPSKKVLI